MNICDHSLLRLEAFLNSADKSAIRFHDAHISAQAEGTLAKIEWAKEGGSETWMNRCARVIPGKSQRKIDDTIAGRFPQIVQEVAATLSPSEYEDRLKALAEENGMTYRNREERAAYCKELMERMAARRAEQSRLGGSTGGRPSQEPGRNACVEVIPAAEKKAEARKEAEVIRVANGGAPAQQRTYSAPAKVEVDHADEARDNLMLLVISKLRPMSVADLNEMNDLADALTYPLRARGPIRGERPLCG
jgi:hypothetical protein